MRSRAARLLIACLIAIPTLSAHGCVSVNGSVAWGDWEKVEENRQIGIEHVAGMPVRVQTKNGSIVLKKSGVDVVDVRAVVRAPNEEKLRQIKVIAVREADGTLAIKAEFPDGRARDGAGVSFEISVPDASGIDLRTSNGPVSAEGFSGEARLESSNGAITLKDHNGNAVLDSSNGRISAQRVTGGVTADTSNGAVVLGDVGTPVVVDTSNGAVDVTLSDDALGPVTLDSSNGKITLAVGSGFAGVIDADTSNANVSVELGESSGASVVMSSRGRHAKVTFLAEGPRSVLDTSNGGIVIKRR